MGSIISLNTWNQCERQDRESNWFFKIKYMQIITKLHTMNPIEDIGVISIYCPVRSFVQLINLISMLETALHSIWSFYLSQFKQQKWQDIKKKQQMDDTVSPTDEKSVGWNSRRCALCIAGCYGSRWTSAATALSSRDQGGPRTQAVK